MFRGRRNCMGRRADMLGREGIVGHNVDVPERRSIRPPRKISRRVAAALILTAAVVAISAVALVPSSETSAFPGRTGGTCQGSTGNCHPANAASFLTVSGFPSFYIPDQEYTITITIADGNGLFVGENSFDLILAAGSGSVAGIDLYVKNFTTTEVATNQAFNTTVAQWTVKWTAPSSGSVTVDTWAVYGLGGTPSDSPYEHVTTAITQIPEFTGLLVPVVGIVAALLFVGVASRKRDGG